MATSLLLRNGLPLARPADPGAEGGLHAAGLLTTERAVSSAGGACLRKHHRPHDPVPHNASTRLRPLH
ncbi:MAG: hypothetical protein KDF95_04805, partial [Rhodocyclaceae bacterium]|nr:hypothetical protein [Rhodocyclaceae bacterium]